MAGFDPREYGIDSRVDVGLFLLAGGAVGVAGALFNFADSEPFTLGAMVGAAVVGAKKLLAPSRDRRDQDRDPTDRLGRS